MSQPPIDLLPPSYVARSRAGARLGQLVVAFSIVAAVIVAVTLHSRYQLSELEGQLQTIEAKSQLVQAAQQREANLREGLSSARTRLAQYHLISFPVQMSRILSTIANGLPASVSLDRLDLNAGERRQVRTARSKAINGGETTRRLVGEMAGFAATDSEIAELVAALEQTPPFEHISLDFSRHRVVRDKGAREFRISFSIDLNQHYELKSQERNEAVAHVEAHKEEGNLE